METDADGGDDRGAERAEFGDGRKLERQVDRGGEDLEPWSAASGPAGEARRARRFAARHQMIDMAAVLERDAFVHGAHHFRQAVPGGEPDEARPRFRLLEPAVQVRKEIGNVAVGSRAQDLLVAEIEQRVAASATHVGAADDGVDEPFESARRRRAGVGQDELARPRSGDDCGDRSVRRGRPGRQLIEPPCAGDHADQAFVGRSEPEGHRRAVRVAGRYGRSRGETGLGRRPFGDDAGDGQRLDAVAEQPRIASEPEEIQRLRRPATEALVGQAARRHVADFEADLACQSKAEIVLAEDRPLGAPKRLRLVRLEPCNQRQRLAGKLPVVGQPGGARLGPFGPPARDDRLRPLIRREDGVADRPSIAVDEKEAIAVAGQADGGDRGRLDAGRGQDLARDVANGGPHGLGIALEKAGSGV